jgi:hypothetical protein
MDNQNKGGDMIFRAGDGGLSGNGGSLNIGPGYYRAGDAVQKINYSEIINSLINDINNSNLTQAQKDSLIKKIMDGVSTVVDIATLTKLILSLLVN